MDWVRFQALNFLDLLALLPFLPVLPWILLRIGTFFLVLSLGSAYKTVNAPYSSWLFLILFYGAFLLAGFVLQACHFLVTRNPLFVAVSTLVVMALLVGEFLIYMIFGPNLSLLAWAERSNTWTSQSSYTRIVKAAPVVETHKFRRGGRYHSTNTLIENWNCKFPPIHRYGYFAPENANSSYCLDVHTGLYGWEWIGPLRSCSNDDLAKAIPTNPCTGNQENDG